MLRDYQRDIVTRLFEAWRTYKSVMVQMPTGTGKTHVLAAVVRDSLTSGLTPRGDVSDMPVTANEDGRKPVCGDGMQPCHEGSVWIVAHRRELVEQIEETLLRYGINTADGRVKVLSIQWLSRHWDNAGESPLLIVIDEAHHALAETYTELWRRHPAAKKLGMTATPCRMSHRGFTDLFGTLITSWSIAEFIRKGQLSLFDYVSIRQDSNEQRLVDSLEKRGADGDYQLKEMDAVLNKKPGIERLYQHMTEFAHDRKGIVYAINIDHARKIAECYSLHGINAAAIDSRTPAAERSRLVRAFKDGEIKVLVNVDVFSEGFDCPDVEFVQMARPTLSLSKYLQQAGRGLRKSSGKECCVFIDSVGLYRTFGLPTENRDWESMFRGFALGKGRRNTRQQANVERTMSANPEQTESLGNGMELVVSHDSLLEFVERQEKTIAAKSDAETVLTAWHDAERNLWGLRNRSVKITDAEFVTVFDTRYGMAAVRLKDNRCGLVCQTGEILRKFDRCQTMKFIRNHLLALRMSNGKEQYVDLYNFNKYERRPEVKRYGNIELLKINNVYYSRTKYIYINNQNVNDGFIHWRKFYLTILDNNLPMARNSADEHFYGNNSGHACLLDGDYETFYRMHRWLPDGSIIIQDGNGKYYHVTETEGKSYIGCGCSQSERNKCQDKIRLLTEKAERTWETEQKTKERQRITAQGTPTDAMPFRCGMKWGLKTGERIIVPPIYRNVKAPVGRYCAVEKNYCQWGVIAVDGSVIVEPKYSDVEITPNGTALLTYITGKKASIRLA